MMTLIISRVQKRAHFQYVNFYLVSEVVALGNLVPFCIQ